MDILIQMSINRYIKSTFQGSGVYPGMQKTKANPY